MDTFLHLMNGGAGNLAAYLAQAGKRVLLVDVDPQANATSSLGVDKAAITRSMYDVLIGAEPIAHLIMITTIAGLDQKFTLEMGKLTASMTSMSESASDLARTASKMAEQQAVMLERGNSHQTQLLERLTNVLESIRHNNHRD